MNNKQGTLEDFGYQFLGPICSEYFYHLGQALEQAPQAPVLFLAREGYFFEKAYAALLKKQLIASTPNHYFLASRTFLFRICIADPGTWELSLKHGFNGTLDKLLVSRFGFTHDVIANIFSEQELLQKYSLPEDFDKLTTVLSFHLAKLGELTAKSRTTYIDYVRSLQLATDKPLLLVDVGYSGTIQKLLTRLLHQDTHGLYFITTKQGELAIGDKTATLTPVFKDAVKMGEGYTMLDRSLFLESLLTSPNGQFIDIQRSVVDDSFHMMYGRQSYTQLNFIELNAVFNGTIQAICDFHAQQIRFTNTEIEDLFEKYTNSIHLLPSHVRPLFDVDDAISGNGNVNPINLFRL